MELDKHFRTFDLIVIKQINYSEHSRWQLSNLTRLNVGRYLVRQGI